MATLFAQNLRHGQCKNVLRFANHNYFSLLGMASRALLRQCTRQVSGLRHGLAGSNPGVCFQDVLLPMTLRNIDVFTRPSIAQFSIARNDASEFRSYARSRHEKKSQSTVMYLIALVVGMVGCTYAAVPLYRRFCQATGYGGTVQRRETVEEKIARHGDESLSREIVVQFNADVADGMPWKFTPCQREVKVKPGQSALAFYTAQNLSSEPITGVSTYNVTPMKAGLYFNKIQCFCFEEQRLLPGEKIDMPVFFYIDPEFASDTKLDGVNKLIFIVYLF